MKYLKIIALFCLVSLLACEQKAKNARDMSDKEWEEARKEDGRRRKRLDRQADSLKRIRTALERANALREDSLFLVNLQRLDTTFVGKGLRLHCKWSPQQHFEYKADAIGALVSEFYSSLGNDTDWKEKRDKFNKTRIARYADRVRQTATHLELRLDNGRWHQIKKNLHEGESLHIPTFIAYIETLGQYLVHISMYEGRYFLLVDGKGNETWLSATPIFSPQKKYCVSTQFIRETPPTFERATVYTWELFRLYAPRNPQKTISFVAPWAEKKAGNIRWGKQDKTFGRVIWLRENVFLMEVYEQRNFNEGKKPIFGVIRCEIEETND